MILARLLRRAVFKAAPPERPTWVWSSEKRIAHRPTCPRARRIYRDHLRGSDYLDDVRAACLAGCAVCATVLDLPPIEPLHDPSGDAVQCDSFERATGAAS